MRKPEQIIGKDALVQLAFEGYAVVPATANPEALSAWYRRKYSSGSGYEAYRDLVLVASGERKPEDLWDDPPMRTYKLKRYGRSVLMAEGAEVRASSDAEAIAKARALFHEPEYRNDRFEIETVE